MTPRSLDAAERERLQQAAIRAMLKRRPVIAQDGKAIEMFNQRDQQIRVAVAQARWYQDQSDALARFDLRRLRRMQTPLRLARG